MAKATHTKTGKTHDNLPDRTIEQIKNNPALARDFVLDSSAPAEAPPEVAGRTQAKSPITTPGTAGTQAPGSQQENSEKGANQATNKPAKK